MTSHNWTFLLVEDDELDVEAFCRAMRKHGIDAELRTARDGSEAFDALREAGSSGQRMDQIVLLDLNMPGMNGHEFLTELREDSELRKTVVFVLTSSDHCRDVRMAYERNVAGYFLKSEIDSFMVTLGHYVANVKFPCQPALVSSFRAN
jgi:CheY-like chemotaxis protein